MSKSEKPTTCVSCGAPIDTNGQQCSLCGWPVGEQDHDARHDSVSEESRSAAAPPTQETGPYCHMCGAKGVVGARFCSSCGTKLQTVEQVAVGSMASSQVEAEAALPAVPLAPPAVEEIHSSTPQRVTGGHIGMLVTAALLVVGALYMITAFSKRAFPPVDETDQAAAAQASSSRGLPSAVEQQLVQLQAEAEAVSGEARIAKQREIVELMKQNSRPDRAADEQLLIAEASGVAEDWFDAGHLFYTWMESQSGELRFAAAQRAVDAFEKGLESKPDDLNVRTALAMAYLNTRAPMMGVQQIRDVLQQDPDHLQGNYYYGVMLTQINRLDQAVTQFERVKTLAGETSPFYQQAELMLQNLSSLRRSP